MPFDFFIPEELKIPTYIMIFFLGTCVGSFLNVCIYRIPIGKNFVKGRSCCTFCGATLKWYDMIPIVSWIILRRKCRFCGNNISYIYPLVEFTNAILWTLTFIILGFSLKSIIYCLGISCLIVLSVIDFRTYIIPQGLNIFLLILGIIFSIMDGKAMGIYHIAGLFIISLPLLLIYILTGGRAIGGGDIKLIGAMGLLLGAGNIIIAFLLGCLYGSVIHIIRMKIANEGKVLALGPYLAAGCITVMWWGEIILNSYLKMLNF